MEMMKLACGENAEKTMKWSTKDLQSLAQKKCALEATEWGECPFVRCKRNSYKKLGLSVRPYSGVTLKRGNSIKIKRDKKLKMSTHIHKTSSWSLVKEKSSLKSSWKRRAYIFYYHFKYQNSTCPLRYNFATSWSCLWPSYL